jgi:uncharacterized membrane protein YcaP (DUF421 family)
MWELLSDALDDLLGLTLEASELGALQMALRALLVYIIVLAITRAGHKRFLGKGTAFDVILGILLGSVASRAITGNAPFLPALVACAVLVWLHAAFAWSAFRIPLFSKLIEGKAVPLVVDGKTVPAALRATDVTEEDLDESLRMKGMQALAAVELAQLERSGQISVVKKTAEPNVVEITVAEGVQTVRVKLDGG